MKTLFQRLVYPFEAAGYQDDHYSARAQARDQINELTNMEFLELLSEALDEMIQEIKPGNDE